MKEIGGYFELELNKSKEYHDALRLNLGRSAFEYLLKAKCVKKVFLPYYTCEVMFESVRRTKTKVEFYHIDENLEPVFNYSSLKELDYFLYTNYFGLKDRFISSIKKKVPHLIIDNSQAFFSKPLPGADTFYSPRKFFGLPDGSYLYTDKLLKEDLETDNSTDRFIHLIGRIEEGAERYYSIFKENDQLLSDQLLKRMSKITQRLLQNINYSGVAKVRKRNFDYLLDNLQDKNLLKIDSESECVPMVYPLYMENKTLRQKLIKEKIFVATYWNEVKLHVNDKSIEYRLTDYIIPLPIDQRYCQEDMKHLMKSVLKYV